MTLEQLMARYFRLRQDLSIAYNQQPWQRGRIDRLASEVAETERQIGAMQLMREGASAVAPAA